MTMLAVYKSKKELKASIGKKLRYIETSVFGPEYRSNGTLYLIRRPKFQGGGREFSAEVIMENDLIKSVK